MFSQHFGQYLLNKGLLLSEQLCDLLACKHAVRAKLGLLAINAGMMTTEQVEKVHQIQHRTDKKFGEIALEQAYLTFDQLEELLASQQRDYLSLSQMLLDRGYLDMEQLECALENYKRDSQLSCIPSDSAQPDFTGAIKTCLSYSADGGNEEIVCRYTALMLRNFQRFLGEEPVIDIAGGQVVGGWLAYQYIGGEVGLFTGLRMEEDVLLALARHYSGESFSSVNDLATDCIAEFLNETNGLFAVNMSDRGWEMDLQPQRIKAAETIPLREGCRIPLRIRKGRVDLFIALNKTNPRVSAEKIC